MAGHLGDKVRTIQNLEIIKSDPERNLMFIKGSIPGSKNSTVLIQKTAKTINRETTLEKTIKITKSLTQQTPKKSEKKSNKPVVKEQPKSENKKTEEKKPINK